MLQQLASKLFLDVHAGCDTHDDGASPLGGHIVKGSRDLASIEPSVDPNEGIPCLAIDPPNRCAFEKDGLSFKEVKVSPEDELFGRVIESFDHQTRGDRLCPLLKRPCHPVVHVPECCLISPAHHFLKHFHIRLDFLKQIR